MEFSRQEQWSGLPFPTPGDLPDLPTPMHLIFCKPSPQTISFPTYKMGTCQTSLVVQWLRLCTSTQRTQVQFLVGELRFHMPCDTAKTFFKKWAHFYRFFFLFLKHPASILSLKYLNIQVHKWLYVIPSWISFTARRLQRLGISFVQRFVFCVSCFWSLSHHHPVNVLDWLLIWEVVFSLWEEVVPEPPISFHTYFRNNGWVHHFIAFCQFLLATALRYSENHV